MSSGLYQIRDKNLDTTLDLTRLKPYGDTMNDGKVQTSFTLPVKDDDKGAAAAVQLAQKMGELVYNGQWFTPLREAISAFTDDLQKTVTGDVKLKLYKGNMINAGVTSPYTLYDEQTASFGEDEDYNQADANGFINLFGLPIAERAKLAKSWPAQD